MLRNTVLVHAPVGRDAELVVSSLASAGVTAAAESSFESVLEVARNGRVGTLLITAEALTAAALTQLAEALDHQPHWSDLPVLIQITKSKRVRS